MISHARLLQLLHYDAMTGEFRWLVSRGRAKAGDVAGSIDKDGYIIIIADQRHYRANRLAWFYVTKKWPIGEVDHIFGGRADNWFSNLRDASHAMNQQNQRAPHRNNKSGLLGVHWHKASGKWRASITGKLFVDKGDAQESYLSAKRQHHQGNTL